MFAACRGCCAGATARRITCLLFTPASFVLITVQALRVWLSNEGDTCFLHTLDVGEDDFAGLKAQQGILVDFGGFPAKLIALLDRCVAAAAQHQPPRSAARTPLKCLKV